LLRTWATTRGNFVSHRGWNRTAGLLNEFTYFKYFQEVQEMVLQKICPALVGAALLMAGVAATADEYRADEFLRLDLSKAVLSPKPLGPAQEFAPVPVEAHGVEAHGDIRGDVAKNDHAPDAAQTRVEHRAAPRHGPSMAHLRTGKSQGAARIRLAHRHGNPLDAQAFDTRIQTWPCTSGGICNWKQ